MYERDATEVSRGALVELCRALRQYRADMVLAGGWAPYFLVRGYFDHCGSVDIDFVLRPKVIERYENIKQILERLGYMPTGSVFRFEKMITSRNSGVSYRVEVDFLTEPEGAEKLPGEWLASVQKDLKACIIEGCSLLFKHNFEVAERAFIPAGYEASATFYCADIVGSLTMKGLALYRMKDKDSYDIYAVAGFYGGGPKSAASAFLASLNKGGQEKVIQDALTEIRDAFSSESSQGPMAVARFMESEDARFDSYRRLKIFMENISH
ncbi:MAG: hypothetical protein QXP16_01870 [Candidatus Bathyarchaeia archaeon]